MNKSAYNIHTVALTALFLMGNAVLTTNIHGFISTFFSFLISAFLTLIIIAAVSKFLNFAFLPSKKLSICFCITALLIISIAAFGILDTLYSYIGFLSNVQMPQTSLLLLCAAMVIPVTALAVCSNSALYKFCLLSAFISGCAVALVFIGGTKNFDLSVFQANIDKTVLTDNIIGFLKRFLPIVCVTAFVTLSKENACTKQILTGAAIGLLATAVCLLQSVLTLGSSSGENFSFFRAVSVISSGSLFTRLDGFCFWLFFVCALIKSAVCIKTIWLIVKHCCRLKKA